MARLPSRHAEHVVRPAGGEDLPVPGVVAEEAELGEHHGQKHGHRELPPGVPDQHEQRPARDQRRGRAAIRQAYQAGRRCSRPACRTRRDSAAYSLPAGPLSRCWRGSRWMAPWAPGLSAVGLIYRIRPGLTSAGTAPHIRPTPENGRRGHAGRRRGNSPGGMPSRGTRAYRVGQAKVLVTGSAGHLGDALTRVLRDRGHQVTGLDVLDSPGTTVIGSVADRDAGPACLAGRRAVLHTATLHKPHVGLARQAGVRGHQRDRTLTLLEEAAAAGVGSFVFTSSTSAFGRALTPAAGRARRLDHRGRGPGAAQHLRRDQDRGRGPVRARPREHGLPVRGAADSRFFPEGDDDDEVRTAYADANVKANEYLYRRVDVADVADAHLLAMERAPRIGFGRYIISATTPFTPDDLAGLRDDAPAVVAAAVPRLRGGVPAARLADVPVHRPRLRQRARPGRAGLGATVRLPLRARRAQGGPGLRSPLARAVGAKGYHAGEHRACTPRARRGVRPAAERRGSGSRGA